MTAEPDPLERSRQELAAAQLLAEAGFAAQAVSRAYFAAFYAAETALLKLGEVRSKHSGVVAFTRVLVREHGFEEGAGRLLRDSLTTTQRRRFLSMMATRMNKKATRRTQ